MLPSDLTISNLIQWTLSNRTLLENADNPLAIIECRSITNYKVITTDSSEAFISSQLFSTVFDPLIKQEISQDVNVMEWNSVNIVNLLFSKHQKTITKQCQDLALKLKSQEEELSKNASSAQCSTLTKLRSRILSSTNEELLITIETMIKNLSVICNLITKPNKVEQTQDEIKQIIEDCVRNEIYHQLIKFRILKHEDSSLTNYEEFLLKTYSQAFCKSFLKFFNQDIEKLLKTQKEALTSFNLTETIQENFLSIDNSIEFIELFSKTIKLCVNLEYIKESQNGIERFSNGNLCFNVLRHFYEDSQEQWIYFGLKLINSCFFNAEVQAQHIARHMSIYSLIIQDYSAIDYFIMSCLETNIDPQSIFTIWNTCINNAHDKDLKRSLSLICKMIENSVLQENPSVILSNSEISMIILGVLCVFKIRAFFIKKSDSFESPFDPDNNSFDLTNLETVFYRKDCEKISFHLLSLFLNIGLDPSLEGLVTCLFSHEIKNAKTKIPLVVKCLFDISDIYECFKKINNSFSDIAFKTFYDITFQDSELVLKQKKNYDLLSLRLKNSSCLLFINYFYSILSFTSLHTDSSIVMSEIQSFSQEQALALSGYAIDSILINIVIKSFLSGAQNTLLDIFSETLPSQLDIDIDSLVYGTSHQELKEEQTTKLIKKIFKHKKFHAFVKCFNNHLKHNTHLIFNLLKTAPEAIYDYSDENKISLENLETLFKYNENFIYELGDSFLNWIQVHIVKGKPLGCKKKPLFLCFNHLGCSLNYYKEAISYFNKLSTSENLEKSKCDQFLQLIEEFTCNKQALINQLIRECSQNLKKQKQAISDPSKLQNILISIVLSSILNTNRNKFSECFFQTKLATLTFNELLCYLFTDCSEEDLSQLIELYVLLPKLQQSLEIFKYFYSHFYTDYPELEDDLKIVLSSLSVKSTRTIFNITSELSTFIHTSFSAPLTIKESSESSENSDDEDDSANDTQAKEPLSNISNSTNETTATSNLEAIDTKSKNVLSKEAEKHLQYFKEQLDTQFGDQLSEEQKQKLYQIQIDVLSKIYPPSIKSKELPSIENSEQQLEEHLGAGCFSDFKPFSSATEKPIQTKRPPKREPKQLNTILTSKMFDKWFQEQTPELQKRIQVKLDTIRRFNVFDNSRLLKGCTILTYELRFKNPSLRIYYTKSKGTVYLLLGGDKQNQKKCIELLNSKILPQHTQESEFAVE